MQSPRRTHRNSSLFSRSGLLSPEASLSTLNFHFLLVRGVSGAKHIHADAVIIYVYVYTSLRL